MNIHCIIDTKVVSTVPRSLYLTRDINNIRCNSGYGGKGIGSPWTALIYIIQALAMILGYSVFAMLYIVGINGMALVQRALIKQRDIGNEQGHKSGRKRCHNDSTTHIDGWKWCAFHAIYTRLTHAPSNWDIQCNWVLNMEFPPPPLSPHFCQFFALSWVMFVRCYACFNG